MQNGSNFVEFLTEISEVVVRKTKKFDRMWRVRGGGSIDQRPLLHNGIIYFGAFDGYLYAVDARTGKEIWRFATSTLVQTYMPPPFEAWEIEIKIPEEEAEKRKETYELNVRGDELAGEYSVKSEYAIKSEYETEIEYK